MANGPKYPNQQLQSVSIETYFPGRLRVFAALGDIQDVRLLRCGRRASADDGPQRHQAPAAQSRRVSIREGPLGATPAKTINSAYEHLCPAGQFGKGVRGFHARAEDTEGFTTFKVTVFGAVENCDITDLGAATEAAHDIAYRLFEEMISEAFRTFISSSRKE